MGENLFFISVNFHFTLGLIFHAKTVTVFMQVELSQFMIEFAKKKKNKNKTKKTKKKQGRIQISPLRCLFFSIVSN